MIMLELCRFFNRLSAKLSPEGYEAADVFYVCVLSQSGDVVEIRHINEDKSIPLRLIVPKILKTTAGTEPSLIMNNFTYMFGIVGKKGEKGASNQKKVEKKKFEATKDLHLRLLKDSKCAEAEAFLNFFNKWNPDTAWTNPHILSVYDEKQATFKGNIAFELYQAESPVYFHDVLEFREVWLKHSIEKMGEKVDAVVRQCSVTGVQGAIPLTHTGIKNVCGSSFAIPFTSYNKSADESYNLKQSANSSICMETMCKYTTALNFLSRSTENHIVLGDSKTTLVFWTEGSDKHVNVVKSLVDWQRFSKDGETSEEDKDVETDALLRMVLTAGAQGITGFGLDPDVKFYVLGYAPNTMGRIAVKFFWQNSFGEMCERLKQHYDDMHICGLDRQMGFKDFIYYLVPEEQTEKFLGQHVEAALMRAVFDGCVYPKDLFDKAVLRIRTAFEHNTATRVRLSIIKGCINRRIRLNRMEGEMITVALNKESTNKAYTLGRIFAILEEIQRRALGELNRNIADRFLSSACTHPGKVFQNLLGLSKHHQKNLKSNTMVIELNKCLSVLTDEGFPVRHTMDEQGRFMLGYYHQRESYFNKNMEGKTQEEGVVTDDVCENVDIENVKEEE